LLLYVGILSKAAQYRNSTQTLFFLNKQQQSFLVVVVLHNKILKSNLWLPQHTYIHTNSTLTWCSSVFILSRYNSSKFIRSSFEVGMGLVAMELSS